MLATQALTSAKADENGISFWVPGAYGSLAAVPLQPGWVFSSVYYHTSVTASGAIAAEREIQSEHLPPNLAANLDLNLGGRADLAFIAPSYVFAPPVLGGQLQLELLGVAGTNSTNLDGVLTARLGPMTATRRIAAADALTSVGDLYPKATLRWNRGVNNFMLYATGDIPVGDYSALRLSNLGIGHGAVDGGVGYTYFNPASGNEFSAVTGFTFNMTNPSTDYRNGIDWHLDWGASRMISKSAFAGVVGYFYDQLTADSGSPPSLGKIYSRVMGLGPQFSFILPMGEQQAFLNFKAYREFASRDRPEGWNAWVTLSISQAPPKMPVEPLSAKF